MIELPEFGLLLRDDGTVEGVEPGGPADLAGISVYRHSESPTGMFSRSVRSRVIGIASDFYSADRKPAEFAREGGRFGSQAVFCLDESANWRSWTRRVSIRAKSTPDLISPPGLGFEMTVDGTVTAVTGDCSAYANIGPGAIVLNAFTKHDPRNYVDAWIRQDGQNKLIHLYLGVAGPAFGTEPPPKHCPPRFAALFGDGRKWRKAPPPREKVTRGITLEELIADIEAERKPSPEDLARQRSAAWAGVRRLHRAALAAHPDRGGSAAAFQKAWPAYEAALRGFKDKFAGA